MNVAAILTAASVLLTALVTGVIAIIREIRVSRARTEADVAGVHVIVNQQRTDMVKEIKALKRMIRRGGGDPEDA